MTNLAERAMLVSLSISAWSGMLVDRAVTEEVNESHKAEKEAGRYNKRLVASKFLAGISSANSNARRVHRLLTLPWEDDGTRILATTGYITYIKKMQDCKRRVEDEIQEFLTDQQPYITEAKIRLGTMFNVDDYPAPDDLKEKFGFDVEIKPMPQAVDFRAQLTADQTKVIVKDIEKRTKQRLENAMNDVFKRVEEVVQHMSERLRAYTPAKDGNKAGRIQDTVVYNIYELATEMLPALNITDDPRITALQQQLVKDLTEHSPEILRADAMVRQATITKADVLLKKVRQYLK
jgi:hypothetical protein